MPDDKIEMSKVNYDAIIERMNKLEQDNKEMHKIVEDVVALNKSLLNTTEPTSRGVSKEQEHEAMKTKLMEGLHYAKP